MTFLFQDSGTPELIIEMTLQAQWGLEKTADSAISISRGLLQAATSDNVQPLAIMACERFGNTLAMCPETCRKVEKTVLPTPPHAVLKFLQGTVGYSPTLALPRQAFSFSALLQLS